METIENLDELRQRLFDNVKKLSVNESKVPKEELTTGKYAKAYSELVHNIDEDRKKYCLCLVFPFQVPERILPTVKQQISNCKLIQNLNKDTSSALYNDYDVEKMENICEVYNQRVVDIIDSYR